MNTKDIWQALGMTLEQFRVLLPGGANDREGFPGTLTTGEREKTYKERLAEQDERRGWRRS